MKVVTYSRVSTDHHDQKPDVQVQELRRYCQARSWEITQEIVDHGFSGSSDARPGLKQLLALVRSRQVDAVLVLKLDRLFRSLKHLIASLEEFQSLGVQFVAVADAIDYTTPQGRLMVGILGSLAAFEKDLIRERTLLGLAHARSQGKQLGRPKRRDDEAIRALRAKGLSFSAIQQQLGVSKGAVCRALRTAPKSSPASPSKSSMKPGDADG